MSGSQGTSRANAAAIPMVRALALGLSREDVEDAARDLVKASRDRNESVVSVVSVGSVARKLGWQAGEATMRGPWPGDASTFVALHDGTWLCSPSNCLSPASRDHAIAVGIGLRLLHWPAMQAIHPLCWVFAGQASEQSDAERLAIREATLFADALTVPDETLARAVERHQGDVGAIVRCLDATSAAIEGRLARLYGNPPDPRQPARRA